MEQEEKINVTDYAFRRQYYLKNEILRYRKLKRNERQYMLTENFDGKYCGELTERNEKFKWQMV